MTPFLLSVHQLSKSSLESPLCIIPGDAITTLGPMSSNYLDHKHGSSQHMPSVVAPELDSSHLLDLVEVDGLNLIHALLQSVDSSLGGLSRSSTVASLDTDSTKSSGNSTSETCAEFRVKYVGAIEKLQFDMSKTLQEPLDLINYIDATQQDGKLPFVPGDEEMILGVSKYGVKVASLDQCDVLHRHPLYLIVRMLCYDDGLGAGKNLLALKTTDAKQEECSIWHWSKRTILFCADETGKHKPFLFL
ncbi:hypothetical protein FQN60_008899 [Etheostoma spectabile]|uniref:Integrin beta-1-binding protein 1 n=1 Tax=Etheostoma spectabile TaxID=54343 RepID=A0A5J5CMT4_9PERO|nr:hypothetical protein FQN60_008899 [Etheostoma spectabile]